MKVLLVKTSSLGDVVHALPAVTDATKQIPDIQFDWVVEESFAEIPAWHPQVSRVIPVALRRWRKNLFSSKTYQDIGRFREQLSDQQYDYVIDAQGLIKSAALTLLAKGKRVGLDKHSARESLAAMIYQQRFNVPWGMHAVDRVRMLFAAIFEYQSQLANLPLDYGLTPTVFDQSVHQNINKPYYVFLHGTTWKSKQWPLSHWQGLGQQIAEAGFQVLLPWGNQQEHQRAVEIAQDNPQAIVIDKVSLTAMASLLSAAKAVIAVDTGLGHLATALNVPTFSLYGATDPKKTGTMGSDPVWLHKPFSCSPCLKRECHYTRPHQIKPACLAVVTPEWVWGQIQARQPA